MNILKVGVDAPEELVDADGFGTGALIRVESSETGGGVDFTEITTEALASGTYSYTIYDSAGDSGTWYRTRYSNSSATSYSDYSDEFQASSEARTYCSIYDVKQRLGIAPSDDVDDEEILEHIDQAGAFIETRTGRSLLPDPVTGTTTYTFDGRKVSGGRLLIFRGIRSITTLKVAYATGDTRQTVPSTDYFIRPAAGDRLPGWPGFEVRATDVLSTGNPGGFPTRGYNNIEIVGTFGWAALPKDVEAIALRIVINSWKGKSSAGGDSFTIGVDGERTFERFLSYEDKKTLDRYASAVPIV